jgi:hypothetical protein
MFRLLQSYLENGIVFMIAGRREATEHPPIVLLSNNHQENEELFEKSAFHVERND